MSNFATNSDKNIAIFINDFDQEYADALVKLSKKLGRPLRGLVLVDKEVQAIGRDVPDKEGVFERVVCDYNDDKALRAFTRSIENNILLLTCSSERNQSYLRKLLPHVPYILGPTESSLGWATHKAKMREMLGSYDSTLVPKVQAIAKNSEESIRSALDRLTFPLIVKPTGLASSMLVSKVHDETELRAALTEGFAVIAEIYERDRGRGEPGFIVEEFIDGDMYSIDVYVNEKGIVWPLPLLRSKTAYNVGREGFYVYQADSHIELNAAEIKDGYAAATQAVHALGLRSCVSHIELFNTKDGWKIIELGARAGGLRQDVYFIAYGIDHAYNELLVKIGLEPEIQDTPIAFCTTINIYAEEEGIITAIENFEEAKKHPSVYRLTQHAKIGDKALPSYRGGKQIANGLVWHTDLEQLQNDTNFVRSIIKVRAR